MACLKSFLILLCITNQFMWRITGFLALTQNCPHQNTKYGLQRTPWYPSKQKKSSVSTVFATSSEEMKMDGDKHFSQASKTPETSIRRRRGRPRKQKSKTNDKNSKWSDRLAKATAAAVANNATLADKSNEENNKSMNKKQVLSFKSKIPSKNGSMRKSKERNWDDKISQQDIDLEKLPLGSLSQLTKVLDKKLHSKGARGAGGDYPAFDGLVQQARDSMSSLLGYNYLGGDWRYHESLSTRNVVIVFGKNLVRDQVTVEYASRIRTLVKLLKNDAESFAPSIICFCGGISSGNYVSDADAGYVFFRHMCESQDVNLDGINIFVDRYSQSEDQALHYCTKELRKYLPQWLEASPAFVDTDTHDAYGMEAPRRKKIQVHFSLISTEYHLCNLNDVHHRSPQQSLLKELENLELDSINFSSRRRNSASRDYGGTYDDDYDSYYSNDDDPYYFHNRRREVHVRSQEKGLVETSWSFQYATYPFVYAKDETTVFLGKCFLLSEELMPLYVNMKGVIEKKEFFQRDNYLMLASIRRSLVSHVEDLHICRQGLRRDLNLATKKAGVDERPIEEVLESAILHLGRCIDLVRPAGLLVSSVTKSDWARAFRALEYSMSEIRLVCDPDRPLLPGEWGKLMDDEVLSELEARNTSYIERRNSGSL